ncbi:MAG: enoyl-CoA hydratase/isomerase family protein [Cytophagaceae bacterium]
MTNFRNVATDLNNGIFMLTINRPDKMNALNSATLEEIKQVIQRVNDDDDIKALIITGAGEKAFVAGADISEIAGINELVARKFSENGQEIFRMIETCSKPVIAAVNGFALGGGCELAMACHIRIATHNARFGLPEVTLGIIPGYGGTQRLTHLVGKGKAFEMMMTGEMVVAEEAKNLGLVNYVTTTEDLLPKCNELINKITTKAPLAIAQIVECVNAAYDPEEKGYQTEANSFMICCKTEDFKEGVNAFLEKRKPVFKGE